MRVFFEFHYVYEIRRSGDCVRSYTGINILPTRAVAGIAQGGLLFQTLLNARLKRMKKKREFASVLMNTVCFKTLQNIFSHNASEREDGAWRSACQVSSAVFVYMQKTKPLFAANAKKK